MTLRPGQIWRGGREKNKNKTLFPTSQKCLHQIFRAEDEKKIKIILKINFCG
jgi:hypothetical protein